MRFPKSTIILLGLLSIFCSKSSKEDLAQPQQSAGLKTWIMGAEHSMDTTITVAVEGTMKILISEFSLCPSHQVEVTVTDDQDTLKQVIFDKASDIIELQIPVEKPISIHAEVIEADKTVNCIWLGQAHFQLSQ